MIANADLPQVLVIDDEMGPRESLRMLLKPSYQVHTADSVEIGLQLLNEKRPDAIVLDIRMPGVTGIEGLRRIRGERGDERFAKGRSPEATQLFDELIAAEKLPEFLTLKAYELLD